ncbi:MAG: elongation factor Ts [Candidatus Kerfeldbacteria bacterium]|nr:elongation factor Ts [Candidatus Kerfeldbacteria bacterium]
MPIDTATIQKLRVMTGAGIMDAKKALTEVNGDIDAALEYLKKHGQKVAAQKQDRVARDGVIGTYLHANKKLAALVLLACETDFVAKTEDFQNLAHDIAMQVAAMDPQYVRPEDIPAEVIEKEKDIFRAQLKQEGKPEKMWDAIIEGKLKKYYTEVCLLHQAFVKDEDKTINDLVTAVIAKLGENIQVKRFTRISL